MFMGRRAAGVFLERFVDIASVVRMSDVVVWPFLDPAICFSDDGVVFCTCFLEHVLRYVNNPLPKSPQIPVQ